VLVKRAILYSCHPVPLKHVIPEPQRKITRVSDEIITLLRMTCSFVERDDFFITGKS
jgi:hypothetical protein